MRKLLKYLAATAIALFALNAYALILAGIGGVQEVNGWWAYTTIGLTAAAFVAVVWVVAEIVIDLIRGIVEMNRNA